MAEGPIQQGSIADLALAGDKQTIHREDTIKSRIRNVIGKMRDEIREKVKLEEAILFDERFSELEKEFDGDSLTAYYEMFMRYPNYFS